MNRYFDYGIFPSKSDNMDCGVNSLDYYMIYQHLLGINLLDYPWQFVAADMNLDHTLTLADVVLVIQLLNGTFDPPADWRSWTFVPVKTYAFFPDVAPDYTYPQYEEAIYVYDLSANFVNQDFVGIKRADVDGSCSACTFDGDMAGSEGSGEAFLELPDRSLAAGEQVRLPLFVRSPAFSPGACSFALSFDTDYLEVLAVEPHEDVPWRAEMWNEAALSQGMVRVAWMNLSGNELPLDTNPLCYVVVQARREVPSLRGLARLLPSLQECSLVSWNMQQMSRLTLGFREPISGLHVFPNPAVEQATASFVVDAPGVVHLRLVDPSGKVVVETSRFFPSGAHQWAIPIEKLPAGVYVLHLSSATSRTACKLVVAR